MEDVNELFHSGIAEEALGTSRGKIRKGVFVETRSLDNSALGQVVDDHVDKLDLVGLELMHA